MPVALLRERCAEEEISYGMCELGVHILFIGFPDGVHWQEKRSVRRIVHYAGAFDAG